MTFERIEEVLAFAIAREEEAAAMYQDLAARAGSPSAREMLAELEAEERNHRKLLIDLRDGKAVALAKVRAVDLGLTDGLTEEPLDAASSYQDILIAAAKKEARAAALYSGLAEAAEDPDQARLFEFLAGQERRHKLRLEKEYDSRVLTEF